MPTSQLPALNFKERVWIRDAYTKLTGWSTVHDQEAELNTLLSFDVDLPLAQKTAALKTCVDPQRKKVRMTKWCPNVLVLELVASSGREAIPIRLLRALSDICLLWEICLVIDEAMTGASLQSRYNLSKQRPSLFIVIVQDFAPRQSRPSSVQRWA